MKNILFENEIAIVLCVKNESPYIKELLEYHYQIGVDKFYIYDNNSEDRSNLQKILAPWVESKIVDYKIFDGQIMLFTAYMDAIKRHRFDCRYLGILDADEFLVPKQNRDLLEVIDSVFELPPPPEFLIGGFSINWRMFGHNGQDRKLEGGVIERFTRRAPDNYDANRHVKTIVNPRRVNYLVNPHNAIYYAQNISVNQNGAQVPFAFNEQNTVEKIQINHYYTKSKEEYEQKASRGRPEVHQQYQKIDWSTYPEDTVEDLTALEIFNRPSFRREIYRDDESTIRDLKTMLADESDSVEKLLTCFHRARMLKNLDAREKFESQSLERFFKLTIIRTYEAQMFTDSLPELLKTPTKYRAAIIDKGIFLFKSLESAYRKAIRPQDQFSLWHRRELLELLK